MYRKLKKFPKNAKTFLLVLFLERIKNNKININSMNLSNIDDWIIKSFTLRQKYQSEKNEIIGNLERLRLVRFKFYNSNEVCGNLRNLKKILIKEEQLYQRFIKGSDLFLSLIVKSPYKREFKGINDEGRHLIIYVQLELKKLRNIEGNVSQRSLIKIHKAILNINSKETIFLNELKSKTLRLYNDVFAILTDPIKLKVSATAVYASAYAAFFLGIISYSVFNAVTDNVRRYIQEL